MYKKILFALREQFDNEFNKPRKEWFSDYMTICIDNEKELFYSILNCSDKTLEKRVFNAVKFEVEYLLEYFELNPGKYHIHDDYLKRALKEYFNEPWDDVLKPIINYYREKRENYNK